MIDYSLIKFELNPKQVHQGDVRIFFQSSL